MDLTSTSPTIHGSSRTQSGTAEVFDLLQQRSPVAVTGATGFIGASLTQRLRQLGIDVWERGRAQKLDLGDKNADWESSFRGAKAVIHLAGLAHSADSGTESEREVYLNLNVEGTRRILGAAERAGIERFVYLSSIKAAGFEVTQEALKESSDSAADPLSSYGQSKRQAEALVEASHLNTVILRPPLVVGEDAKANLRTLLRLVRLGLPLPLGAIKNKRSLISKAALIEAVLRATALEGRGTYYVADPIALSTSEIVRAIAEGMGRPARLFSLPPAFLSLALTLFGMGEALQKLAGSLEADPSKFALAFGPIPAGSARQALIEAGRSSL